MNTKNTTHVAFLRGINVGGHHKVPMAELRKAMEAEGYQNVATLLNSGNIIFESTETDPAVLKEKLSAYLEKTFGFSIPTIIRSAKELKTLYNTVPFQGIEMHKNLRRYISFLQEDSDPDINLPWTSETEAYTILSKKDKNIISLLDISVSKTPIAMKHLENFYGKNITTRNWNTIEKIMLKLP